MSNTIEIGGQSLDINDVANANRRGTYVQVTKKDGSVQSINLHTEAAANLALAKLLAGPSGESVEESATQSAEEKAPSADQSTDGGDTSKSQQLDEGSADASATEASHTDAE